MTQKNGKENSERQMGWDGWRSRIEIIYIHFFFDASHSDSGDDGRLGLPISISLDPIPNQCLLCYNSTFSSFIYPPTRRFICLVFLSSSRFLEYHELKLFSLFLFNCYLHTPSRAT